jgi:hypothetical protein
MVDVISAFREQDTRDELGLGTIRDGFANILFPGTSTIQTRARYFLFWVKPCDGGAHIERHIMNLPLSREEHRLHDLRRSLAAYRMVFGQPRQEDMLAYLLEHVPESELLQMAEDLRINLEPLP